MRRIRIDLVTTVVAFLFLAWGASEVFASNPICASFGKSGASKGIRCLGTCPGTPQTACAPSTYGIPTGRGTFPPGHPKAGKTYAFCACAGETEATCCHLVGILNQPGTKITEYYVEGTCIACPLTGLCQLAVQNGEKVAECDVN